MEPEGSSPCSQGVTWGLLWLGFSWKTISGRGYQGAWRQDKLIVVNRQSQSNLDFDFEETEARNDYAGETSSNLTDRLQWVVSSQILSQPVGSQF
jgi:hypothetical protein